MCKQSEVSIASQSRNINWWFFSCARIVGIAYRAAHVACLSRATGTFHKTRRPQHRYRYLEVRSFIRSFPSGSARQNFRHRITKRSKACLKTLGINNDVALSLLNKSAVIVATKVEFGLTCSVNDDSHFASERKRCCFGKAKVNGQVYTSQNTSEIFSKVPSVRSLLKCLLCLFFLLKDLAKRVGY